MDKPQTTIHKAACPTNYSSQLACTCARSEEKEFCMICGSLAPCADHTYKTHIEVHLSKDTEFHVRAGASTAEKKQEMYNNLTANEIDMVLDWANENPSTIRTLLHAWLENKYPDEEWKSGNIAGDLP